MNARRSALCVWCFCFCASVFCQEPPAPYQFKGKVTEVAKIAPLAKEGYRVATLSASDDLSQSYHADREPKGNLEIAARLYFPEGTVAYGLFVYNRREGGRFVTVTVRICVHESVAKATAHFQKRFVGNPGNYEPAEYGRGNGAVKAKENPKSLPCSAFAVRIGDTIFSFDDDSRKAYAQVMEALLDGLGVPPVATSPAR